MNTKLIALAVASAFALPMAAQAETTLYGQLNLSYDAMKLGSDIPGVGAAAGTSANVNTVQSNNSRFGIKGEEALGGGVNAIYQVESGFAATTGRTNKNPQTDSPSWGTLASRDTFAGLSNKTFGTFWAGRRDTPYKRSSSSFDFFSETIGDMNNIIANPTGVGIAAGGAAVKPADVYGSFHQRMNRSLGYDGAWNGLYVDLQAGTPDINASGGVAAGTPRFSTLSGLVGYRFAGADVLYSVEENKNIANGAGGFTTAKAQQVAVGYTLPAQFMGAKLGAVYEKIDSDVAATKIDNYSKKNYWLNASVPFAGNNAVGVAYGKAGSSAQGGALANGAKMWALGATHNFTKQTSVYAMYANMKNDANGTYGLGVDHGDVSSEYGPVGNAPVNGSAGGGQTVKGLSVGLLTKF